MMLSLRLPPLHSLESFPPSTSSSSGPLHSSSSLFKGLRLLWRLLAVLLLPPLWRRPLGVRPRCSRPFTFGMFSFPLIRVSVWVVLWLRVPWFSCYYWCWFVFFIVVGFTVLLFRLFRLTSLSAGSECLGEGGGGGSSHSSPRCLFCFIVGGVFLCWLSCPQISWSGLIPIGRCFWGVSCDPPLGVIVPLPLCCPGSPRLTAGPSSIPDLTGGF